MLEWATNVHSKQLHLFLTTNMLSSLKIPTNVKLEKRLEAPYCHQLYPITLSLSVRVRAYSALIWFSLILVIVLLYPVETK